MSTQNIVIVLGVLILTGAIVAYAGLHVFYGAIYKFGQIPETPEQYDLKEVRVAHFPSEDGQDIQAWIKPPEDGAPVIFYFMGNFTSIGPSVQRLQPFLDAGMGLAALVYRGANGAPGNPSERNFAADARALYDQLDNLMGEKILPSHRVVHGYSLGTGIATRLAVERDIAGLVLEAAYAWFCDYFTDKYHGIPFCYLMWKERYDSADIIETINAPLLMLHGEKDDSIKINSAKQLYVAAREPKRFVSYENGTHVDLNSHGLSREVLNFYSEIVSEQSASRQ
jgi:fermentation-respiration switch protein FrsA (DUF1100 family)